MANKFEKITRYIPEFEKGDYGDWVFDTENDGSSGHPIQIPYVNYSESVNKFLRYFYEICDDDPEYDIRDYREILTEAGIEYEDESMEKADVSLMDAKTILALINGVIRADRFVEGFLFRFLKNGAVLRWLKRLQEIDESS